MSFKMIDKLTHEPFSLVEQRLNEVIEAVNEMRADTNAISKDTEMGTGIQLHRSWGLNEGK